MSREFIISSSQKSFNQEKISILTRAFLRTFHLFFVKRFFSGIEAPSLCVKKRSVTLSLSFFPFSSTLFFQPICFSLKGKDPRTNPPHVTSWHTQKLNILWGGKKRDGAFTLKKRSTFSWLARFQRVRELSKSSTDHYCKLFEKTPLASIHNRPQKK